MKFIQFGNSHVRNEESFIRGCKLFEIEYKKCMNLRELQNENADFIWSPMEWFDPNLVSKSKILFGPQFYIFPERNHMMYTTSSPDGQCYYDVLSEWVKSIFDKIIYNNKIPYICLPFGIDTENIKPNNNVVKDIDCLIYYKDRHPKFLEETIRTVNKLGISYKMIEYRKYSLQEYFSLLDRSKFCIWVGRHESQGFGLQECLSKNVPIFLYDVNDMKEEYINKSFKKRLYHWSRFITNIDTEKKYGYIYSNIPSELPATAAPYWDKRCGEKYFSQEKNMEEKLSIFISNIETYKPREFIIDTLSDKVCFSKMLKVFDLN